MTSLYTLSSLNKTSKDYVHNCSVHICIGNVDVSNSSSILFQYLDGTSDLITFYGNCGLTFTNTSGNTSEKLLIGDHSETISNLMTFRAPISIVCHNIKGKNTWSFACAAIVSKVTIIDNSDWSGLNDIRIKEYNVPTGIGQTPFIAH